jgi:hypothetical protein
MKIINLLILELLLVFGLVIIIPSILVKEQYLINNESISILEPLTKEKTYFQKISNSTNLNSISLMIKNPNIENTSKIYIKLEDIQKNTIKEFAISGANVGDPSWVKLKFEPIVQNEIYIIISTDNDNPYGLQIYHKDNNFNLQATAKINSISSRIKKNIVSQYNQFSNKSLPHSIFYLTLIIYLNYLYLKKNHSNKII